MWWAPLIHALAPVADARAPPQHHPCLNAGHASELVLESAHSICVPSSHFKEAGHGIQNQSETHPGSLREEGLQECNRKHSPSVKAFSPGRLQSGRGTWRHLLRRQGNAASSKWQTSGQVLKAWCAHHRWMAQGCAWRRNHNFNMRDYLAKTKPKKWCWCEYRHQCSSVEHRCYYGRILMGMTRLSKTTLFTLSCVSVQW